MRTIACLLLMLVPFAASASAQSTIRDRVASYTFDAAQAPPRTPTRSPRSGRPPRLLPILIGAGVGAALFMPMAGVVCEGSPCGLERARFTLGGAALGFVIATRWRREKESSNHEA
jgi:hypothetical protein